MILKVLATNRRKDGRKLRLDYSVECEECGQVESSPAGANEAQAREDFRESGWKLINDSNTCPACVVDAEQE